MNKREFLKTALMAGAITAAAPGFAGAQPPPRRKYKHWVWINPDKNDALADIQKKYASFYNAGIRGIFFEADSEMHFRAAKAAKIEAHRWIWTLNRGEKTLLDSHPSWYAISRSGTSCATNPPYVGYYRWLCPSRPEVKEYLAAEVHDTLKKDYVDGIHLDYVRYCDVILAVNLWSTYGIEQNQEHPQYDYCYCDVCRSKFKEEYGIDITEVKYPDQSLSWRKYRYDRVNRIVNHLATVAQGYKKPITAAVFPTPEVARRIVRQDWTNWNLDAVCPMIYHGFYKEEVRWIGDAVAEGLHFLNGKFPLYAGLYLPDFKNLGELEQGIGYALKNGAAGISLFGDVTDDVLAVLARARAS